MLCCRFRIKSIWMKLEMAGFEPSGLGGTCFNHSAIDAKMNLLKKVMASGIVCCRLRKKSIWMKLEMAGFEPSGLGGTCFNHSAIDA